MVRAAVLLLVGMHIECVALAIAVTWHAQDAHPCYYMAGTERAHLDIDTRTRNKYVNAGVTTLLGSPGFL